MSNKRIGYKIRGKYYLESDVHLRNTGKDWGEELYRVCLFDDPDNSIDNVPIGEIHSIYEYDDLAYEIYKLRVQQLECDFKDVTDLIHELTVKQGNYATTYIMTEDAVYNECVQHKLDSLELEQNHIASITDTQAITLDKHNRQIRDLWLRVGDEVRFGLTDEVYAPLRSDLREPWVKKNDYHKNRQQQVIFNIIMVGAMILAYISIFIL